MSTLGNKLANMMAVLPVIIITTFVNMIIAFVLAGTAFVQLIAVYGWNKSLSLGVAILIAIVVHLYIWVQPKIREYISARS